MRFVVPILPKRRKHKAGICFQYSPEVIRTINVLRTNGGERAVSDYLQQLKENNTVTMHTDMAETLTRAAEPRSVVEVGGTLENALRDAEAKAKHYASEVLRCQQEQARWDQVASGLRDVMKLTTGPVARPNGNGHANGNGKKVVMPNGYWAGEVRAIMKVPMTRKQLVAALCQAHPDRNEGTIYQAVLGLGKKGVDLLYVDDKYYLPEMIDSDSARAS